MAFNLARKVHIRRSLVISICMVICAALVFTAAKYIKDKVSAATPEGSNVTLQYTDLPGYYGAATHNFKISFGGYHNQTQY